MKRSTAVMRSPPMAMTPRALQINPRSLGLSPRDLEGRSPHELASALRQAAAYLLDRADEIEAAAGRAEDALP